MRLSGSQKRALGVRSAFLGLLRRLRPGESRSNRESGFFLLCIQITRNRRISFPSSAATVVAPGPPMSGKDGCCSLVVLPSVPPRTSRCGIPQHRESPGSNPGSVILFLQFFCCSVLLASYCACFQVCRWAGAAPLLLHASWALQPAYRKACRPPTTRSRVGGPATTSAPPSEAGITTVRASPRELRLHPRCP